MIFRAWIGALIRDPKRIPDQNGANRVIGALLLSWFLMASCVSDTQEIITITPLVPTATLTYRQIEATWMADPCNPPPEIRVDGEAGGTIFTWVDFNANGQIDEGEPPLAGVEYGGGYGKTDEHGLGSYYDFVPGCACDCWKWGGGLSVFVTVPNGFEATTPTEIAMNSDDDSYAFGFRPLDSTTSTPPATDER